MEIGPNDRWDELVLAAARQDIYQRRKGVQALDFPGRDGDLQLHVRRAVIGHRGDLVAHPGHDVMEVPCRSHSPGSKSWVRVVEESLVEIRIRSAGTDKGPQPV